MGRVQALIIGCAALFLAVVVVVFRSGTTTGEKATASGVQDAQDALRDAPAFELPREDGSRLSLSSLGGHVVLVNFWATWCPPCAEETPSLEALHASLAPKGLTVVGVSVDDGWEPVKKFREAYGVTYSLVLDPSATIAHRYGTFKYPETYLVDREGQIVHRYVGAVDWAQPDVVNGIAAVLAAP